MAGKSNNVAIAVAIQPIADTFTAPTLPDDKMPVSNLSMPIEGVTIVNDEYTGSPIKNADQVAGKRASLSFNVKLRPPGGSDVPAANAFLLGRILQAAKMAEVRTAAAIPVAAEALGVSSTTTKAVLGTTASSTAGIYKGMALTLSDNGASYKERMTAIRSYDGSKGATLFETLGSAPAANYQIPKQLSYMRSVDSSDPIILSFYVWLDGHRFSLMNARLTSMNKVVPTSTRDQAAYPEVQVTFDVTIATHSEEATPAVPSLGAIPLYKDGDLHVANKRVAGSTFTVNMGITTESPPNPNKVDGSDAPELTGSVATVSMTRQKYLPSYLDTLALADAQAYHGFFAQWGQEAGKMVQVLVPDFRFNYQNIDLGGTTINENGDLLIDALDRSVVINFPY